MWNMTDTILTPRDLGLAIKTRRRFLRLSQLQLAQAVQVSRETIVALESGRNVGTHVLMAVLLRLGQGIDLVDGRRGSLPWVWEGEPDDAD